MIKEQRVIRLINLHTFLISRLLSYSSVLLSARLCLSALWLPSIHDYLSQRSSYSYYNECCAGLIVEGKPMCNAESHFHADYVNVAVLGQSLMSIYMTRHIVLLVNFNVKYNMRYGDIELNTSDKTTIASSE